MKAPFYLFVLLVLFSPLAIDIFLPAIPAMAEALQTPMGGVQATVGLFLLTMGLGQLVAGPLADRFGRRPLALVGATLYLVGSLVAAMAQSVELLWLSRVLQGLGACAVSVSAMSGIRDTFGPEKAGPMFSYVNGIICVIPALAPVLGGLLTEWWGWRANFLFMALYALIAGQLVAWRLPETRPADTCTHGTLLNWSRYQPVLASPVFRYHGGLVMLSMAIIIGYVSLAPAQLMVTFEQTPMAFALWFGANAVINIVAAFVAPRVVSKLGKGRTLMVASVICLLGAALMYALYGWYHPLAFMGPVAVASLGFCLVFAVSGGAALAPFGNRAGTASALLGLWQMTGASLLVGGLNLLPIEPVAALAVLMMLPALWMLAAKLFPAGHREIHLAMEG